MPRVIAILALLLLVVLTAAACNGDGDGEGADTSPTPVTPSATASPDSTPTPEDTPTPTDVPPDSTPSALPPDRVSEFLAEISRLDITREDCTLDMAQAQLDCGDNGEFPIDPPPEQNPNCELFLADGEPVAVACANHDPFDVEYYEIR